MQLLIHDTTVVCVDTDRRILSNAAVAIRDDRIVEVGPSDTLSAKYPDFERMDGRAKAVLPGLINSHTHTVLLVLRGTVEDMSGDVIYGYMTPISFAMRPSEREAVARLGCLEAIRSGTTTLVDPFRHVASYAGAMATTGLRLYLSESGADALTLQIRKGIYEYDRAFGEQFIERIVELAERFHGAYEGRVQCQISAHAPDNCSPWMLARLNDLAERYALRRTVHLSQGTREVEQVRRAHGCTSAQYLRDHHWLGDDVVGAHWTYCTESDIDLLAEYGVHMAHCPANSSRRGPHRVLIERIMDRGVNIALGTDNMTEDMFQAMEIGSIVHRGGRGGGVDPTPGMMLDAVTRNGALALGRGHDLGSVEAGKKADLTVIDLNRAHLRPIINLVSNIVHYGHPGAVDAVMVDGKFLLRDGVVLSMNETDVIAAAQEATVAAWRRLHEMSPDIELPPDLLSS